MHHSRVEVVLIDVEAEAHERTLDFWAAATGAERRQGVEMPEYTELTGKGVGFDLHLQRIEHGPGRIHLDIATTDVAAETARLVALGAQKVATQKAWEVLRDPAGNWFCVIPTEPGELTADNAATWE